MSEDTPGVPPLRGGTVLVTGAGGGIGRAVCLDLAARGARVLVSDLDPEAGEQVVSQVRRGNGTASSVPGDITAPETLHHLRRELEAEDRLLTGMVLAAGAFRGGRALDATVPDFQVMLQANVLGVWLPVRDLADLLAAGASIVVVASVAGLRVHPSETLYGVTKSASIALARGLAAELAERGIRVNALCPGPVGDQGMQQRLFDDADDGERARERLERHIPLGRLASVADIARTTRFLLDTDSSYLTGTTVSVDGGLVMH